MNRYQFVFFKCLLVLLLAFTVQHLFAQKIVINRTEIKNGFERVYFTFEGRNAFVTKPKKAANGNPWVWRAQFPDWHTEVDSILLSKGFHIVFVNTNDMYGAPAAMQVWDRFYDYLLKNWSFAPKVALEAVSRGGLYAYGWAKRNPEKVNCILAEAPVCDFKSWPAGKGKGMGAPEQWKELQTVYGFKNEQEALEYDDLPIHQLEGLAAFKVPILHLIGLNDHIVPPDENTYVLVQNYIKLGGPATIVPMTRGLQTLNGHHFPIETPEKWANFIEINALLITSPLSYEPYIKQRNGLVHFNQAIQRNRVVNVAFLGGSITHNDGWRPKTIHYLKEKYPNTEFRFISAGIPSLGSLPHAFRLQRDVLDSADIDLLFLECAVNDAANQTDSLVQLLCIEGIVRHLKQANPKTDVVMMAFADPEKLVDYQKGIESREIKNQELLAEYYQLPSINMAKMVYDKIQAKEFTWAYDFKDLHPSPFGQELYFSAIKTLLNQNVPTLAQVKLSKALHKENFDKGAYVEVSRASLGKGWNIAPKWRATDGKAMREGFYNIPVLESVQPGGELSFTFTGNAVGIAVLSGPDAGEISYKIDGKSAKIVNTFTKWSADLYLPWYIMLEKNLKRREHRLEITLNDKKGKNSVKIMYFLVNR